MAADVIGDESICKYLLNHHKKSIMRMKPCKIEKYRILFFVIFLSISLSYSQDSIRRKKLFVGRLNSLDLSSAILSQPLVSGQYKLQPKTSATSGLDILYQINTHFSISFGVQISNKDGMTLYPDFSPGGYPSNQNVWFRHELIYLDLPLKLNYYFSNKKVRPYLSVGISPSLYLYEGETQEVSPDQYFLGVVTPPSPALSGIYNPFNPFNTQGQIGAGVDANKRAWYKLRLEAVFRCSFASNNAALNPNYAFNYYYTYAGRLYSFGLALSCLFGI